MATQAAVSFDDAEDDDLLSQLDIDQFVADAERKSFRHADTSAVGASRAEPASAPRDRGNENSGFPSRAFNQSLAKKSFAGTPNQSRDLSRTSGDLSSGRRPLALRQKAELTPTLEGYQPFAEAPWRRVMSRDRHLKSLSERFSVDHMLKECRIKDRKKFPVNRYPMLCLRIKYVEYNGSDAVFHDPSGEVEGWIDPGLLVAHPNLFRVGTVVVMRNFQVVASSWARPNVSVKESNVLLVAARDPESSSTDSHSDSDSVTVKVLDPTVDLSQFVDQMEATWKQVEKAVTSSAECGPQTVNGTSRLSAAPRLAPPIGSGTPTRVPNAPPPRSFAGGSASGMTLRAVPHSGTGGAVKRSSLETASVASAAISEPSKRPRLETREGWTTGDPKLNCLEFPDDDEFEDMLSHLPSVTSAGSREAGELPRVETRDGRTSDPNSSCLEFPEDDEFEDMMSHLPSVTSGVSPAESSRVPRKEGTSGVKSNCVEFPDDDDFEDMLSDLPF